jgi:hypothetical protein
LAGSPDQCPPGFDNGAGYRIRAGVLHKSRLAAISAIVTLNYIVADPETEIKTRRRRSSHSKGSKETFERRRRRKSMLLWMLIMLIGGAIVAAIAVVAGGGVS